MGELVITQAVLKQQSADLQVERFAGLIQGLEDLALQTRELQESVMAVRAQPVKSVFSRMPRLVRELAQMLGKEARIVLSGENTEVDEDRHRGACRSAHPHDPQLDGPRSRDAGRTGRGRQAGHGRDPSERRTSQRADRHHHQRRRPPASA
ncbi:MAG: hypothetical protein R3C97_02410 [Geminicoccaceae bacterium]